MTRNQIGYQQNVETERNNRVVAAETQRHNLATEDIGYRNVDLGYANLNETARSNRAREQISYSELGERYRHNTADEAIRQFANYESQRHNILGEELGRSELAERQRSNKATEAIRYQELVANQQLGYARISADRLNTLDRLDAERRNLMSSLAVTNFNSKEQRELQEDIAILQSNTDKFLKLTGQSTERDIADARNAIQAEIAVLQEANKSGIANAKQALDNAKFIFDILRYLN